MQYHILQAHADIQKLRHHIAHVLHTPIHTFCMQVRTDNIRLKTLLQCRDRLPPRKCTATMPHIKHYPSLLRCKYKVKPFVFAAQKRGIVFDVGHGGGAFSWRQAIPALQQGFQPDVISTDLHAESMNGGMKDMSNVMSKFLNIGMSLQDVILHSTWKPANVIKRPELGTLSVGAEADIAVFNLLKGDFGFLDIRKTKLKG